jgi:hypothetical protein
MLPDRMSIPMRFARVSTAILLLLGGCKARDGDILVRVCQKTTQKAQVLVGNVPVKLVNQLPATVSEASMATRVQNRIRWDRYLSRLDIDVQTTDAGTVTLRGNVPDLAIRQRILDLAKSTTGVQNVEDRMTLPKED